MQVIGKFFERSLDGLMGRKQKKMGSKEIENRETKDKNLGSKQLG